ncbi:MAG TPA: DUF6345 domain-containing protein [Verrucomicrobiae bacterium]|jgi:hypothetical protein
MNKIKLAVLGVLFSANLLHGQSTIQFTGIKATPENAIQLHWTSTNHELYEIDEADSLNTTNITWNKLYDQYPSQGTNTFIGDFGNYDIIPAIPNPKFMPMRFYRIVDEGADTDTTDSPSVEILSPTNASIFTGQMTVTVVATCTNLPVITTGLYVDGQKMDTSDDGSNYVINTCEWLNGAHALYAVATARSSMSGPNGSYPIYTSHGVSSFTSVTFSNLISGIAFSQPFFQPSLGQTQAVTANFAANCDWTLQIEDQNSNVVRNASGSGTSMEFDWDGMSDGETNIADGVYYYLISATTNGESGDAFVGGSDGGSSPPSLDLARSSSFTSETPELWVMPTDDSGEATPLIIYPPGFDTNGLTIVSATPSEVHAAESSFETASFETADAAAGYSGPSGESSEAPTRPPTSPMKNSVGTFGVAYFSWSTPQTVNIPENGLPYPSTGVCHLDGSNGSTTHFDQIPEGPNFSVNFIRAMEKGGWTFQYARSDTTLHANDMRRNDQGYGGGELFTTANIGLFLDHGDYGTDPDYNPGSSMSKQTYFRSSSDFGDGGWLRMCQIGFGGNLEWMGILACNSLNTFSSMSSAGAIPLKTTHMVCGCSTIAAVGEDFGALWAKKMLGGVFASPETVANAWFDAGRTQYSYATNMTGTTTFRVAGYPECMDDTLKANTAPISPSAAPGNLTQVTQQVYP